MRWRCLWDHLNEYTIGFSRSREVTARQQTAASATHRPRWGLVAGVVALPWAACCRGTLSTLVRTIHTVLPPVTHRAEAEAGTSSTLELGVLALLQNTCWAGDRLPLQFYNPAPSIPSLHGSSQATKTHPVAEEGGLPVLQHLPESPYSRLGDKALHLHPASSLLSLQSSCPSQRQKSGTHWSPLPQAHCQGPQGSTLASQS